MAALTSVTVEFCCPECGSEGYEETLTSEEIERAVTVEFPCDECASTITLSVTVDLGIDASTEEV